MKHASLFATLGRNLLQPNHPAQLVLFVTDRCNCRCAMCFNAANVFSERRAPDLPLDAICNIADSLRPLPQLLLSGGEPFLRDDIPEVVSAFHSRAGTGQVSIPTNGVLSERIAAACARTMESCPGLVLNINISLDSVDEEHDVLRGLPGCYRRVAETFERLAALRDTHPGMTVNIVTIITRDTLPRAEPIVAEIRRRFTPNYHAIGLLRNDTEEDETNRLMDTLEETLNPAALEKASFNRLPLFGRLAPAVASLVKKRAVLSRRARKRCFTCLAGRKIVVVTNEGVLMPCEPLWLEERVRQSPDCTRYAMAPLADFGFDVRAALNTDNARRVCAFVAQKKCWCSYACAIQNGILYSPKMHPLLLVEMLRG